MNPLLDGRKLRVLVLFALFALAISGCVKAKGPADYDYVKDNVLYAFAEIREVLKEEIGCSEDRIVMNANLTLTGINKENKERIKAAIEKRLDVKIPDKYFKRDQTIGEVARYAGWQCYKKKKNKDAKKIQTESQSNRKGSGDSSVAVNEPSSESHESGSGNKESSRQ